VSFAEDAPPPSKEQVRDLLLRMLREMQPEFVEHIPALAEHARATALQLGLSGEAVEEVVYGTQLHDIGMLAIPESMLAKPSALDPEEWALIHRHTVIGERMLAAAPELRPVAAIVRSSHERWDGQGYPDGLVGEQIPLGARIVTVCDAYAAMTSPRAYRPTIPQPVALAELARCSGAQFDPAVVDAFITTLAT
jgi:HD-GYP domain-containing protein (c-di-GMP phosphodiesterase class II)